MSDIGIRRSDPVSAGQCPSIHIWSDLRCIRREGHDGRCRGRVQVRHDIGTITTVTWMSDNGVFAMHGGYKTDYPTNMRRGPDGETPSEQDWRVGRRVTGKYRTGAFWGVVATVTAADGDTLWLRTDDGAEFTSHEDEWRTA